MQHSIFFASCQTYQLSQLFSWRDDILVHNVMYRRNVFFKHFISFG